jgi:adenine-specific DNA-methyltransferase
VRIDGFSDREDSQPTVPDFLLFGKERELDLSEEYGDKKFKRVKVRGLIHTLKHYHFTVEESTPLEEEVALDPELAGKIFENLLAAYNPETGATARKQTGSFYTPREIVNYMVDEALIAYLKGKLEEGCPEGVDTDGRLRYLFSYEEEGHSFTEGEVELLVAGIDQLKALDPAVGSGAFPMGILHKLVFILGRLDPRNEKWKERQKKRLQDAIAAAERIEDVTIRENTLSELEQQIDGLEEAFEKNTLDYGRKLYLIENCLYGVDIQPIAVQIAKMRFFISLIADQKVDPSAENLGVRPLPNLETKLVAANTLIGIEKPEQMMLGSPRIDAGPETP